MPPRPLTVILNYDQRHKFVTLLPDRFDLDSRQHPREHILREAKNKFRSKTLSSVFLQGGSLFGDHDDLPPYSSQVWVGKGEPYAGPPSPIGEGVDAGDMRIIGTRSFIDESAVKQLQRVSALPGVKAAIGMPDLHPGSRFPIGCAVAAEGIYPALIGSDIGCGIALYHLSSSAHRARQNPKKIASSLQGLDDPWTGSVEQWLTKYGIGRSSDFDRSSLGTVGAGNHFAELCTPEEIVDLDICETLNVKKEGLYLLVHTGSRGLGSSILARQTSTNSNPYMEPGSPHLTDYLVEHDYAMKWAIANRDLVAHRIVQCLTGLSHDEEILDVRKILDVTHNSVTAHSIRLQNEEETRNLWVHRKGAAPADKGVVPCPGSRGDFSWLLQPVGDGQYNGEMSVLWNEDNQKVTFLITVHSLAHGAGRRYGRQVLHTGGKINKAALTTTVLGSEVVCQNSDLLIEERPEAYKDVQYVVDDMEEKDMCRKVVKLRPIVTYKVREGGEGRK